MKKSSILGRSHIVGIVSMTMPKTKYAHQVINGKNSASSKTAGLGGGILPTMEEMTEKN